MHRYPEGPRGANAPRQLSGRGLAYWTDGRGDERILYVTPGLSPHRAQREDRAPVPSFGKDGVVDMKVGVVFGDGQQIDLETGEIGLHSTPAVVKDVVLVGSSMKEGMTITTHNNTKGLVRALRRAHRQGAVDVQHDSQARRVRQRHVAQQLVGGQRQRRRVDADHGRRRARARSICRSSRRRPTTTAASGPATTCSARASCASISRPGKRKWHFQFVHHPIWDHDMSSAPLLADVTIDGRTRKVVAVPSKQALLYVFDRVTGEPIWPIVETPVPKGDVPGEWYAPTQPHPAGRADVRPQHGSAKDDLIDFTPELRAQAMEQLERYKWGASRATSTTRRSSATSTGCSARSTSATPTAARTGRAAATIRKRASCTRRRPCRRLTPESVAPPPPGFSDIPYQAGVVGQPFRLREAAGTGTYADVPQRGRGGAARAAAAAGAGRDGRRPRRCTGARRSGLARRAGRADAAVEGGLTVQGLSIVKPPYGVLAAIDLEKGAVKWQVPHGDTPDAVRNHPLLKGMTIPKTGQGGSVGLVITKTLVILGDPQVTTTTQHPRGAMLRAYDKATGKEVGAVFMPAPQSGSPMTYMLDGRQYIVVAVSGGTTRASTSRSACRPTRANDETIADPGRCSGADCSPRDARRPRAGPDVWDGVYTEEQAKRGEALYSEHCVRCHGASLQGNGEGAGPLTGPVFTATGTAWRWAPCSSACG